MPEYWIVDLVAKRLEVYREPSDLGCAPPAILGSDDAIAVAELLAPES